MEYFGAEYFIIRDAESHGDVATVWNWKRREWCWDVDGEYTAGDGFAYSDTRTAANRARVIIQRETEIPFRYWGDRRTSYTGVRVVDRQGLKDHRDSD